MAFINKFATQNWVITPVALAVNQPPPTLRNQTWLLVLSGVNIIDFRGTSTSQWRRMTFSMQPDVLSPLNHAVQQYGLPRPANSNPVLIVDQWAPFATLNAAYDAQQSIDAGFAVDSWRITPFVTLPDAQSGQPLGRLFNGIDVDVAVRDTDAILHRVGFNVTLLGRIGFVRRDIIL